MGKGGHGSVPGGGDGDDHKVLGVRGMVAVGFFWVSGGLYGNEVRCLVRLYALAGVPRPRVEHASASRATHAVAPVRCVCRVMES